MNVIPSPEVGEYGEYYEEYIDLVRGKDISALMLSQIEELRFILDQVPDERANTGYMEGKWTYKQLLGHINDTEKIMFFRALCLARNEKQALPGFDQDEYVKAANFQEVPLEDFLGDIHLTRRSLLYFIKGLTEEASARKGTVNGQPTSVRALLYIIPGHFEHHLNILKSIPLSKAGNKG